MTEHFNHTKVSTWNSLTDSERHWLGYLGRKADDGNMVREWVYWNSAVFTERVSTDLNERNEIFAVESLMTALATPDRFIAFRALLQAAGYLGALHTSYYRDAFHAARDRVERFLVAPRNEAC